MSIRTTIPRYLNILVPKIPLSNIAFTRSCMVKAAKVAFARVSSQDQNLDRQLEAFKSINPDRIFTDKLLGKNIDRPGFKDMMDYVRGGDHLYVASMDRLACNLKDLLEVTESPQKKGVAVHFLKENISLDPSGDQSPIAKLLLSMMGAVAEFERSLIREQQAEGIAIAKTRGVYKGRAPSDPSSSLRLKNKMRWGSPFPVLPRISRLDAQQSTNI